MLREEIEPLVKSGYYEAQLARHFGIGKGSIRYWLKKYSLELKVKGRPGPSLSDNRFSDVTSEQLSLAVVNAQSLTEVLNELGLVAAGSSYARLKKLLVQFDIDTSHFKGRGWSAGLETSRFPPEVILVRLGPDVKMRTKRETLHRALQKLGRRYECSVCGIGPEWNGRPLVLPIDHEDGDWRNNLPDNLRYLCPNCHYQTPTFSNKNRNVL